MKLIRCYIENYGKLHQFSYDFKPGLNTILQENGWGKTTFSSFIKAMLFGLPTSTKKDLDENERAKYTPWQSGNFGGWLEFELKGKTYRVERFWGEKQSKDKFKLIDLATNQEVNSPTLIEDTLKINAETFERSTYVPHNFSLKTKNDSIKERLGKLLDNIESESVNKIDDKLKELQTDIEHQKGKGGKLWELIQKQDYLENEIKECEQAKLTCQTLNTEQQANIKKIEEISIHTNELKTQIQKYNDSRVALAEYQRVQQSLNEIEQLKKEAGEILNFFKNSPPDQQTLVQLNKTLDELKTMENTLDTLKNGRAEKNIEQLSQYFKQGVPSDIELEQMKQKNARYLELSTNKLTPTQAINKLSKKKFLFLCTDIVAILLAIAGVIGLIVSHNPLVFLPITIIGVLLGVIGFYFTLHTPETEITQTQMDLNRKKRSEQTELHNALQAFISKYENTSNFSEALISIDTKRQLLNQYRADKATQTDQVNELERRLKLNNDFLTNYLSNYYSAPINYAIAIDDVNKRLQKLEFLNEQLQIKQAAQPESAVPTPIIDETFDLNKAQAEISKLERDKDQLGQQNAQIISKLDNLLTQASAINSLKFQLDETKDEIEKQTNNLKIIQQTRNFLQMANTNLTSKYLSPLTNSFKEFSKKIVGNMFENVSIDTDLNMSLENFGEQKNSKFYSLGSRDVLELCMRFALAKTLFENENPPIILDDTFSNLDDEKTKKALDLIENITDEFQIIYLVCHSSRVK